MQTGQVIKTQNSFYYVQAGSAESLVACKLRGRFKKERCQVVTGDRVEFEALPDGTGIIEKRLFTEGSDVKAGAALFRIDPRNYQAAYDAAKADLDVR